MNLWKLRLTMAGTLAAIFSLSTLVFTVVLSLFSALDLVSLATLVIVFNLFQWLISPYVVDALYRTREISEHEYPKLHEMVDNLSKKSGVARPKLMLAQIPIPNAFAYGSPIAKTRVAVTDGLLKTLETDEVEAVIGHELGHLKHRDVQTMMFVSLLPAVFYYIGYSFMMSSWYRGQRQQSGNSGALMGIAFMAFSWTLQMFILYLSRLREYYADRHSALVVEDGPRKLSTGLAKIVQTTKKMGSIRKQTQSQNAFKTLFITNPDRAETDSADISRKTPSTDAHLVDQIVSRKLTLADRMIEALSTHPNISKRLKALRELD